MLHKGERRTLITKTVKEEPPSADYIQLYHGDSKLLQESLEVVQRSASQILGAISARDEEVTPIPTTVLQNATALAASEVQA